MTMREKVEQELKRVNTRIKSIDKSIEFEVEATKKLLEESEDYAMEHLSWNADKLKELRTQKGNLMYMKETLEYFLNDEAEEDD